MWAQIYNYNSQIRDFMMQNNITRTLLIAGIVLIVVAFVYHFLGDKLSWLGKLPGDIRYEGENTKVFFPITTMILLSVIFSVVMNLIRRFL